MGGNERLEKLRTVRNTVQYGGGYAMAMVVVFKTKLR